MPVSDDPTARVLFVLSTDRHKPKETRPCFVVRPLTRKQAREKRRRLEEAKAMSLDDAFDRYLDVVMEHVTDWRNMPVPFSREALEDRLTDSELAELARNCDYFDEVDQKN